MRIRMRCGHLYGLDASTFGVDIETVKRLGGLRLLRLCGLGNCVALAHECDGLRDAVERIDSRAERAQSFVDRCEWCGVNVKTLLVDCDLPLERLGLLIQALDPHGELSHGRARLVECGHEHSEVGSIVDNSGGRGERIDIDAVTTNASDLGVSSLAFGLDCRRGPLRTVGCTLLLVDRVCVDVYIGRRGRSRVVRRATHRARLGR